MRYFMKKIYIIGAGGHGKVVLDILLKIKKIKSNFEIIGFLDEIKKEPIMGYPVIGSLATIKKMKLNKNNNFFIIALGKNELRERIVRDYKDLKYIIAIDPSAVIGLGSQIGEGTVIKANSVISPGTKIGKHCIINSLVSIEQDTLIEDFVHVYPNVSIYGENTIKKGVTIFSNASTENGVIVYQDLAYGEHLKAKEGEKK